MPVLEVENLEVSYPDGTCAISGLSFTLAQGESAALIGANGAGKTSLLLALMGLLPFSGQIRICGTALTPDTAAALRQKAGLVFQNPDDQLFMPSIQEDLAFGLRNQGMPENEVTARIAQWLAALRLEALKNRTALKLSGGEKRMAALATVLVMEPTLMLLDEPTAFLDPKARRSLIHTLNGLTHTKLIATHDLAFAAQTCTRSLVLQNGRLAAEGASRILLYDSEKMEACGVEAIGADTAGGI